MKNITRVFVMTILMLQFHCSTVNVKERQAKQAEELRNEVKSFCDQTFEDSKISELKTSEQKLSYQSCLQQQYIEIGKNQILSNATMLIFSALTMIGFALSTLAN